MTQEQSDTVPEIKVKRKRKRLYEPMMTEQPEPQTSSASVEITQKKPASDTSKETEANHIIMDYTMWSAGTGLIPVPLVDMMAITAIELNMVKKLCNLYGVPFSEQRGKSLIVSLIGGIHVGLWAGSLLKFVPVVGLAGVILPMPFIAGAMTYGVGKVFMQHFETGGTLLDFKPSTMKAFFAEKFKEGKAVISE